MRESTCFFGIWVGTMLWKVCKAVTATKSSTLAKFLPITLFSKWFLGTSLSGAGMDGEMGSWPLLVSETDTRAICSRQCWQQQCRSAEVLRNWLSRSVGTKYSKTSCPARHTGVWGEWTTIFHKRNTTPQTERGGRLLELIPDWHSPWEASKWRWAKMNDIAKWFY